jgi:hypothetical protein
MGLTVSYDPINDPEHSNAAHALILGATARRHARELADATAVILQPDEALSEAHRQP